MCATPKPGVLLPSSRSPAWPAPLAYYPLTAGSLDSWPDGQYSGTNQGAQFTLDTRFGSVLTCNQVGRLANDRQAWGLLWLLVQVLA